VAFDTKEILVVLFVVLILFGATAIPKLARAFGKAQGEFSKARRDFEGERRAAEAAVAAGAGSQTGDSTPIVHEPPAPASEEAIRDAARRMGIDEETMALDQVKKELNERLG